MKRNSWCRVLAVVLAMMLVIPGFAIQKGTAQAKGKKILKTKVTVAVGDSVRLGGGYRSMMGTIKKQSGKGKVKLVHDVVDADDFTYYALSLVGVKKGNVKVKISYSYYDGGKKKKATQTISVKVKKGSNPKLSVSNMSLSLSYYAGCEADCYPMVRVLNMLAGDDCGNIQAVSRDNKVAKVYDIEIGTPWISIAPKGIGSTVIDITYTPSTKLNGKTQFKFELPVTVTE